MDSLFDYQPVRPQVKANLKQKPKLKAMLDPAIISRAALLHKTSYLPGYLSNLFVVGMEKLPLYEEPAPILAFSHKKIHDVWSILEFCLGRPLDRFHNVTAVIQAGVHSAIYPWRDLFPDPLKKKFLRRPALFAAKGVGKIVSGFFRAAHTNPVYREGVDIPADEDEYNATLADGRLLDLDFDSFRRLANRTTMESVVKVQKAMSTDNASLIIAPEGKYRHDGSVAPTLDLLGYLAYRKERPTFLLSLSYDELCPDRRGRIDAFIFVADPVSPPVHKLRIGAFLKRARKLLQKNTTVTASHLIASILYEHMQSGRSFTRQELLAELHARSEQTLSAGVPCDPGLKASDYRAERLRRFWRAYRKAWFVGDKNGYRVVPEKIEAYDTGERTVNDLVWNRNHLLHLPRIRGGQESSRLRSVIAWLRA